MPLRIFHIRRLDRAVASLEIADLPDDPATFAKPAEGDQSASGKGFGNPPPQHLAVEGLAQRLRRATQAGLQIGGVGIAEWRGATPPDLGPPLGGGKPPIVRRRRPRSSILKFHTDLLGFLIGERNPT